MNYSKFIITLGGEIFEDASWYFQDKNINGIKWIIIIDKKGKFRVPETSIEFIEELNR